MAREKAKVKNLRLSTVITTESVANVEGIVPAILGQLVDTCRQLREFAELHDIDISSIKIDSVVDLHTLQFKDITVVYDLIGNLRIEQEAKLEALVNSTNLIDQQALKEIFTRDIEQEKQGQAERISRQAESIENLVESYTSAMNVLKALNANLEQLNKVTVEDNIPSVFINNPLYTIRKIDRDDSYIHVITKPIILTDLRGDGCKPLNMGRFVLKINTRRLDVTVHRYASNIDASGYYHPHVTGGGNVCWGNAMVKAQTYLDNKDFDGLLRIVMSLLSIYNSESPYKPMGYFATGTTVYSKDFVVDSFNAMTKGFISTGDLSSSLITEQARWWEFGSSRSFSKATIKAFFSKKVIDVRQELKVTVRGFHTNFEAKTAGDWCSSHYDWDVGYSIVSTGFEGDCFNIEYRRADGIAFKTDRIHLSNISLSSIHELNDSKVETLTDYITRKVNEITTNAATV